MRIPVLACALALLSSITAQADVYWAEPGKLGVAADDGSWINREFLVQRNPLEFETPFAWPCGLAADASHLYWIHATPSGENEIARANLDGSSLEPGFVKAKQIGCGIAVGPSGIYWGGGSGAIGRANLDGSHIDSNFIPMPKEDGIQVYASQLAINSTHVFAITGWECDESGLGAPNQMVVRARLDGTRIETALGHGTGHRIDSIAASDSTLFVASSLRACFGKTGSEHPPATTGSAIEALTGGSRTTLLDTGSLANTNLVVRRPYVFWSQYGKASISRMNLDGSGEEALVAGVTPSAIATPTALAQPSNDFTLGHAFSGPARERARVEVAVPGPGTLQIWGPGVFKLREALAAAGEVRPSLRLRGTAKRLLSRSGHATIKIHARFTPTGGTPRERVRLVSLVRPRRAGAA